MGYTTKFKGELKFTADLSGKELAKVKSFFGQDCREHPEWQCDGTYIDLELNDDFTGIRWDAGTEKNDGMLEHINLIISEMKKDNPSFGLSGIMLAQGEELEDRWQITADGDMAHMEDLPLKGKRVECPHCHESFLLED